MFLNIFVLKNKDMALKIDKVTLQFEIKPNYDANYSSINFFAKKLWNNVAEKLVKFNFFLYLCTSIKNWKMKKILCVVSMLCGLSAAVSAQIQTNAGVQYLMNAQKDMSTDFYD